MTTKTTTKPADTETTTVATPEGDAFARHARRRGRRRNEEQQDYDRRMAVLVALCDVLDRECERMHNRPPWQGLEEDEQDNVFQITEDSFPLQWMLKHTRDQIANYTRHEVHETSRRLGGMLVRCLDEWIGEEA